MGWTVAKACTTSTSTFWADAKWGGLPAEKWRWLECLNRYCVFYVGDIRRACNLASLLALTTATSAEFPAKKKLKAYLLSSQVRTSKQTEL
mmetsp:Transcript_21043/g.35406  ORF Transcript_21043/g.35406 Transcript_21043/m.35406 type:complete len:91 (+) Transcript_21043:432-704(+)